MNILDGPEHIVCSCEADAGIILDPVVDLLQMVTGPAADLEHEVEFSGQIVAGYNVRIHIDVPDELVIITRMLHSDLHQDGNIISKSDIITDDGVRLNDTGLLHLFDPLNHRRDGQMNGLADVRSGLTGIVPELSENLIIQIIRLRLLYLGWIMNVFLIFL